jgi:hypothetical protein
MSRAATRSRTKQSQQGELLHHKGTSLDTFSRSALKQMATGSDDVRGHVPLIA